MESKLSTPFRVAISRYREAKGLLEQPTSAQSRRGLDWTNFFISDVQTGFGAFVAFYLASLHWSKQDIGLALTIGTLAGVLGQIPGGALADISRWKRTLAAVGILMLGAAALILALFPTFTLVLLGEFLHGATSAIVGPAIASVSSAAAPCHREPAETIDMRQLEPRSPRVLWG